MRQLETIFPAQHQNELLTGFGFDKSDDFTEEADSWWKKMVHKTKRAMTQKEVADRLEKVERAAEIACLDKPQAEANQCQAQAASALITSLKDTNNAYRSRFFMCCVSGLNLGIQIQKLE